MKRRTFLISTTVGIVGLVGLRYGLSKPENAVAKVLYKRLPYLKLDAAGVRKFAADVSTRHVISTFRLSTIDTVGPLYTDASVSPNLKFGSVLRHGEDRIVTQYLISSDFFINGADTTRTVHYLGYFNPLVACNNPFARPIVDAAA
jgi:hypothetical protein